MHRCLVGRGPPSSRVRPHVTLLPVAHSPDAGASSSRPYVRPSSHPAHAGLLRVVRTIVRADSDPARQTLFAHLMESRPFIRAVYQAHEHLVGTRLSALFISVYGLAACVRVAAPAPSTARILAVASQANARRQLREVIAWVGTADCAWLRTGTKAIGAAVFGAPAARVRPGRALATLRVIRAVDRRHGFLVACRVAAAIAWYARSLAILRRLRPGAVLVSSDANPDEAGFLGAARVLAIPQIYASHAYPTPFSPPLDFTLSILDGEAAVQGHRRKGPIAGRILQVGLEGESAPMDAGRFERQSPSVGIFPPKAFSWDTLAAIVADCRTHFHARQIVIRWHPSMLEPPRLSEVIPDLAGIIESPREATLPDVARQCDWVVAAENSNVHLPVMKLGIPTVVVKGLGLYPDDRADLYGFVANGIVFPPIRALRDLQAAACRTFFEDGWATRFAQYDASYLRSRSEIVAEVRRSVLALAAGGDPGPSQT